MRGERPGVNLVKSYHIHKWNMTTVTPILNSEPLYAVQLTPLMTAEGGGVSELQGGR